MGLIQEFKEFAVKGNALDLAVGVVLGAAFGRIVSSLVDDVIMPPIGMAMGGMDFANYFVTLGPGQYKTLAEAKEAGAATLNYGNFIQAIIYFLIVAFALFLVIRVINRFRRKQEEAPPAAPAEEVLLLREIRDSLQARPRG
ncbi:MAG TPA: large conductance mechanosensitive channel protein MscL [Thermoanaerobaculia bacterium]|jgi:large conductance mechanosensitive channel|nr:large conductance mechanosensitive channel protein MscL [Thermoanaerobaculia bacterium]